MYYVVFAGFHVYSLYSIGKYTIHVDLMVYERFTLIPITKTENGFHGT